MLWKSARRALNYVLIFIIFVFYFNEFFSRAPFFCLFKNRKYNSFIPAISHSTFPPKLLLRGCVLPPKLEPVVVHLKWATQQHTESERMNEFEMYENEMKTRLRACKIWILFSSQYFFLSTEIMSERLIINSKSYVWSENSELTKYKNV